jgi:hypothetical protein
MMQMEDRVRNRHLLNLGLAALVAVTAACAKEPAKPADTPAPAAAPVPAPSGVPAVVVPDESPEQRFKAADLNADGLLDEAEMRAEAKKMRGANAPPAGEEAFFQEARSILLPADTDKDGKISRQEYLTWSTAEAPK